MSENTLNIQDIINKLTSKGEKHAQMIWVGDGYSKADLLKDLRELQKTDFTYKPMTMIE